MKTNTKVKFNMLSDSIHLLSHYLMDECSVVKCLSYLCSTFNIDQRRKAYWPISFSYPKWMCSSSSSFFFLNFLGWTRIRAFDHKIVYDDHHKLIAQLMSLFGNFVYIYRFCWRYFVTSHDESNNESRTWWLKHILIYKLFTELQFKL